MKSEMLITDTTREKIVEKERKTRILINNLTKGIQVNISFRLVDFISSFMLTDL